MKKLWERLDQKYVKVALYAAVTTILTILGLMILYLTQGLWKVTGSLIVSVVKPLILGAVISYLLYPLVKFFEKHLPGNEEKGKARGIAVLLTLLLVAIVIGLFFIIILWSMTKQLSKIDISSLLTLAEDTKEDALTLLNNIRGFLDKIGIDIPAIGNRVTTAVTGIVNGVSTLFFGVIFAVYFMIDATRLKNYWNRVVKAVVPDRAVAVMKDLGKDLDHCFSGYIRGQSLDALIVGTVTSVIFILIGMPYAFLIGLIIGVGNLIPYFGPILGYAAVVIVNITTWNPKMLIIGLIIVAVIMFIDGNIVNPKLLAGTISVHPLLVVASLLAGGALGGIVGMLIAVPAGAFIKLQFEKWLRRREKKLSQCKAAAEPEK